MEKMLNEYLQFASSQSSEITEKFSLSKLLKVTASEYQNENIKMEIQEEIQLNGRKNLIKRCFNNIIDNALKYANTVNIKLNKSYNSVNIIIDDDGPGVAEKERENVFKPFYKINKSRGDSKSSVGLGLSIASDIIRSHGGNIVLENSPKKGLRVRIFLPS
jgi:two-component system osmolarity sensor histidine kinase EnvZ